MAQSMPNLNSVYAKWESRNPFQRGSSAPPHSRMADKFNVGKQAWKAKFGNVGPPPLRRSKSRNKNHGYTAVPSMQTERDHLGEFKSVPTIQPAIASTRPFMGRCCSCVPQSRSDIFESRMSEAGLKDVLNVETKHSKNGYFTRKFYHLSFTFQCSIKSKYPDVSLATLTSPRVIDAIQRCALENRGSETSAKQIRKVENEIKKSVKAMVKRMRAQISRNLTRFTLWFLHKFFGQLLSSVVVNKAGIEMLKKAHQRNMPVIMLPTHRSHLDYILITFLLVNFELPSPHIAAGDNLIMPFFGALARGLGGFFIRRKLDQNGPRDVLYRSVLQSYIEELLKRGQWFEFFVEGGRTRSGKALSPKGGLLSIFVDHLNEGVIPDAYIVPVGISYDKIVDGDFNNEQMGQRKKAETFWGAWAAIWRVLKNDYGIVRVNFSQPFSLREYMQSALNFELNHPRMSICSSTPGSTSPISSFSSQATLDQSRSDASLCNPDIVITEENNLRAAIQGLAEHVIYTAVNNQAIMSTQMMAFIYLTRYRQGGTKEQLIQAFDWLKEEIRHRGRDLGFIGTTMEAVDHANRLLGDELITPEWRPTPQDSEVSELWMKPSITLPDVFHMAYYSNSVHSVFALESAIANAVYALVEPDRWLRQGDGNIIVISRETLFQRVKELCTLLKYEYIFKPPCMQMDAALQENLEQLIISEILQKEEDGDAGDNVRERNWSKQFSSSLSFDVDYDSEEDDIVDAPDTTLVVKQDSEYGMEKLMFLRSVLAPILETYYVAACNLTLLQSKDMSEKDFIKAVHSALMQRVNDGVAAYAESASLDTVRNTVRSFLHLRVMDSYCQGDEGGQDKMLGLHYRYKVEENLQEFIQQWQRYQPHVL